MINVGEKFVIEWADSSRASLAFTLLCKSEGLWWAKNSMGITVGINPLSDAISQIIKLEE